MRLNGRQTLWVTLSLLVSSSTLVCCALPALLVALGLGAAVAGLVSAVPGVVWFSEHKVLVFALAGALFLVSGWRRHADRAACPADPALALACGRVKRIATVLYWLSIVLYAVGFTVAFLYRG